MAAALALARRGLGLCAPNPAVGALVVKDRVILARGFTKPGGRPHAETEALRDAGPDAEGATLYVTLEPCSHQAVTPPCTDAIIAAKIHRVVYAIADTDPRVAGQGHELLERAGIEVSKGVLETEAVRANLGHFLRVGAGRPMVTLKLALTADGFAAGSRHDRRLVITGAAANGLVHTLRAMHDAVMIGSGTIIADDSLLTVRLPGLETRRPLRIVLVGARDLPEHTRLAATADKHPTMVITGGSASEAAVGRLRASNIEVLSVPNADPAEENEDARDRLDLRAVLKVLGARGLTRIFCEGGPRLAASLLRHGLADEVVLLVAPKPLGREGVPGLAPDVAAILADPARYQPVEERSIGVDRLTRYERVLSCLPVS